MNRKIFFFLIIVVLVIAFFAMILKREANLISPTPVPIATPVTPKTFKFDKNTDLKSELEKVNPQVLDSDFN